MYAVLRNVIGYINFTYVQPTFSCFDFNIEVVVLIFYTST